MLLLLMFFVGGSLLLILVGLPLLAEKVPPNRFYGFRVRATLGNRAVWYAVNRFAARRLIASGGVLAIAAVVLYFVPGLSLTTYSLMSLGVFLPALAVGLIQSVRFVHAQPSGDVSGKGAQVTDRTQQGHI